MTDESYIIETIRETVSEKDIYDSTLQSLPELSGLLTQIDLKSVDTLVALGAGNGGLPKALGKVCDASVIHAVDIDEESLQNSKSRGLEVHNINLETEMLPFDSGSVDLVISFGLLEHLTWFDNVLSETKRVLRRNGHLIFSMPNLAGWTNRLSILLGRQPRNVEFSKKKAFGILDAYGTNLPVNHVHTATIPAFLEFLDYYSFETLDVTGLHPYQRSRFVVLVDRMVSWRPSLCRRFAVLARLPVN